MRKYCMLPAFRFGRFNLFLQHYKCKLAINKLYDSMIIKICYYDANFHKYMRSNIDFKDAVVIGLLIASSQPYIKVNRVFWLSIFIFILSVSCLPCEKQNDTK